MPPKIEALYLRSECWIDPSELSDVTVTSRWLVSGERGDAILIRAAYCRFSSGKRTLAPLPGLLLLLGEEFSCVLRNTFLLAFIYY